MARQLSRLGAERYAALDLFERLQLEAVVQVRAASKTQSDAGRRLFHVSREQRSVVNDADRCASTLRSTASSGTASLQGPALS